MLLQNSQVYVNRDFFDIIKAHSQLECVFLRGPRQVGKTTLLDLLDLKSKVFLDDLGARQRAQQDPAFFCDSLELPCLIDEAQYAPNLFPEIKKRIDAVRRKSLREKSSVPIGTQYFLTGSNQTIIDESIKESLAGRSHLYYLHGLSVKEILQFQPDLNLKKIIFQGGFPELYIRQGLSVQEYLNSYILSFIEKDIARESGVSKLPEFLIVLRLLAARTGQFINFSELALAAGVETKTVQSWTHLLQRNFILDLVEPYESNLTKRITKSKKLHFYDVGLCARLQGHVGEEALWNSPQIGSLFESLVFSEIIKTKTNFLKEWRLFTWRTKEKNEIDFILNFDQKFIFIEVKLGIQSATSFSLDVEAEKVFQHPHQKIVVTAGGEITALDTETTQIPIQQLGTWLLKNA